MPRSGSYSLPRVIPTEPNASPVLAPPGPLPSHSLLCTTLVAHCLRPIRGFRWAPTDLFVGPLLGPCRTPNVFPPGHR
eukprot:8652194-Alexandrium_andersonii.AAC.1